MRRADKLLCLGCILALAATACRDGTPETELMDSLCSHGASLKMKFQGNGGGFDLRQNHNSMTCESMRRPDGEGARLRFVVDQMDMVLSLIIAIPDLERGATGAELPSNLTLSIQHEDAARFFGTQGAESCWADIHTQDLIRDERYTIAGEVYCIAPLPEVNGSGSTSIELLEFSTTLDWNAT